MLRIDIFGIRLDMHYSAKYQMLQSRWKRGPLTQSCTEVTVHSEAGIQCRKFRAVLEYDFSVVSSQALLPFKLGTILSSVFMRDSGKDGWGRVYEKWRIWCSLCLTGSFQSFFTFTFSIFLSWADCLPSFPSFVIFKLLNLDGSTHIFLPSC